MTFTIFYSWQSDLPNNINRSFIESAIKKAIQEVNKDIQIQDAIRDEEIKMDKDTQGISGIPPITETIFKKISECAIFIPDLTFITNTDKERYLSNPNVLIEYGWALKEVGYQRMIPIMNEYYGSPSGETLPFDMRHLRFPITYNLSFESTNEKRIKEKSILVRKLKTAIKSVFENNLIDTPQPPKDKFEEHPISYKPSIFMEENEVIKHPDRVGNLLDYIIPNTQHIYLRIVPTSQIHSFRNSLETYNLIEHGNLRPMSDGGIDYSMGRNKYGAYSFYKENGNILNFSQLFKSNELWGIDAYCLDKNHLMSRSGVNFGFIPCVDFERTFYTTLKNYLDFSQNTLKLPLPLKLIAGATDVEGYRMTPPPGRNFGGDRFAGNILESNLYYDGIITDYNKDPSNIIIPFFKYVWEECGLNRPDMPVFR